ncbi:hypothetical protein [Bacillus mycoides]|uniref:hypothetical protein n=1 Tax=Bacillus mycoides TaxID=1405 RepID=UPI001C0155CD|nr:hypothetical protein [Bacillus mycoides]QWH79784.1 hypothetical protein EXW59_25005 [Bacillus mycoides]QWI44875.1 hypothetical protein EXW55_18505 [Bacillus mycoides]
MANNKLIVEVSADTTEALEGIKEVTEAANECVAALERLDKVMGRFTDKNDSIEIEVPVLINGKQIAEDITRIQRTENRIVARTC